MYTAVSDAAGVEGLVARINAGFKGLNMIINNAGAAFLENLATDTGTFEKAGTEMLTNYLSVIRLNEKLLPLLKKEDEAVIVMLEESGIKVFELMPSLVNTEFSAEIDGHKGIPAAQVADEFMAGLEKDKFEIRVAGTEQFYQLYLSSPAEALKVMNQRS